MSEDGLIEREVGGLGGSKREQGREKHVCLVPTIRFHRGIVGTT